MYVLDSMGILEEIGVELWGRRREVWCFGWQCVMYGCLGNKLPERDGEEDSYVTSALNQAGGNEAESAAHPTMKSENRLEITHNFVLTTGPVLCYKHVCHALLLG